MRSLKTRLSRTRKAKRTMLRCDLSISVSWTHNWEGRASQSWIPKSHITETLGGWHEESVEGRRAKCVEVWVRNHSEAVWSCKGYGSSIWSQLASTSDSIPVRQCYFILLARKLIFTTEVTINNEFLIGIVSNGDLGSFCGPLEQQRERNPSWD